MLLGYVLNVTSQDIELFFICGLPTKNDEPVHKVMSDNVVMSGLYWQLFLTL